MAHVDKLIVTNRTALKAKYGSGTKQILRALEDLIRADDKRGLVTRVLELDDARTMRVLQAPRVIAVESAEQNKNAIDAAFRTLEPDYLLLLGSRDVVPHQHLRNPMFHKDDDEDASVPSDLPYACEAPYSVQPRDFRGPTRVVGRLPDLTGGTDPAYLARLVNTAATYVRRAPEQYLDYFGVSAAIWKASTELSLRNTFGGCDDLQVVPRKTFEWPARLLRRRAHFINCHGGDREPLFYGQPASGADDYPEAHSARYLRGKVVPGTVVAAECCYGAQLYAPSTRRGQAGICNTYLEGGAYAFFGSSTIAYGPSSGNGEADYICQFFLQQMLGGASLGRAALEARQKFVQWVTILDPHNLKTLAQFDLMGDPSIHPVAPPRHALSRTRIYKSVFRDTEALPPGRELRRQRLIRDGLSLARTVRAVKQAPKRRPLGKVRRVLEAAARESKLRDVRFATYVADDPARDLFRQAKLAPASHTEVHVAFGRRPVSRRETPGVVRTTAVLATVQDGEIVRLRRLHAR